MSSLSGAPASTPTESALAGGLSKTAQLGRSSSTHTGKHKVLCLQLADVLTYLHVATDNILCCAERVKNVASALKYIKTGPHGQLISSLSSLIQKVFSITGFS